MGHRATPLNYRSKRYLPVEPGTFKQQTRNAQTRVHIIEKKWYAVKLIDRNSDTCSEQVYYVWHTFDIPMCTQRLAPLHFPVEAKAANGPGIKSGNQVFLWLTSLTEMLQDLNWKSQSRRMKTLLCFTWFCTQGSAPADGLLCRETEKTHKNEDVSPYHEWASGRPIQ